ncbi:MAG TPA: hypothetical protein VFR02_06160, partial [bacterium]|nr:hypothetical protein [bacterium]
MALLALDVLYVRSLFYFEIQDTDINCYAGIAHGLLQGRALYSDLWDFKPPAVFWTYALAEKICGYGLSEVFFLNILFNGLALAGAYACGYGLSRSRWTGFLAACFWALVSPQVPLGANEPNTELFINVLQLFALLFWAGWKEGGGRRIFPLTAGLCLGAAALYKQVPVITACCMALAPLLAAKGTAARRAAAGEAGRLAAGFLAPWALTCAYYWAGGRLGLFLQATFADNLDQVSLADNLWSGWMPKNLWPGF